MKFFGLSTSEISPAAKYAYILIFAALVGGSIFYLMSKINQEDKNKSNKKKKSPAKNSSASPANAKASPTKGTKK